VPEAIETVRPLMGPNTFVVPLMDGVEAPDRLATAFGKSCVVGGLAVMFGSVIAPRVVDLRNAFERELNGSALQGPTRMTRASNG
jgi:ketopantoate reductase